MSFIDIARAQAEIDTSRLADAEREAYARAFTMVAVASYWDALHRAKGWPATRRLPPFPSGMGPTAPKGLPEATARQAGESVTELSVVEAAHRLSSMYAALLPESVRARYGVFYTPPCLSDRLLALLESAGVDWETARVLDPACGGGAFLVPVALRMMQALRRQTPSRAIEHLALRLRGTETDPFAAWLSRVFLQAAVSAAYPGENRPLTEVVEVRDALLDCRGSEGFDVIVGNPPYGKVSLPPEMRERFSRSLYGHANLYGLFTDQALALAKEGGLIGYVTPASFLAGQYFKELRRLRGRQAPPVKIDFVSPRTGLFR